MDDGLPDCESVISAVLRGVPPADTDAALVLLYAAVQALREMDLAPGTPATVAAGRAKAVTGNAVIANTVSVRTVSSTSVTGASVTNTPVVMADARSSRTRRRATHRAA